MYMVVKCSKWRVSTQRRIGGTRGSIRFVAVLTLSEVRRLLRSSPATCSYLNMLALQIAHSIA